MKGLEQLLENNRKWAQDMKERQPEFFQSLTEIQTPEYLWIGCSDSRITPATSTGLLPGQLFVHRNIANLVVHSDMNCLSVLQFGVDVLKIKHIIVCGHYGCGGVQAALKDQRVGLTDNWLRHIQDIAREHQKELLEIQDEEARLARLCELNIVEQVLNVGDTTVVQDAWRRGQELTVNGWIYSIADGIFHDVGVSISRIDELTNLRKNTRIKLAEKGAGE